MGGGGGVWNQFMNNSLGGGIQSSKRLTADE